MSHNTSQTYHIEYGQTKSKAQTIGKIDKVPLVIGRTLLNYTEKYKCLDHMQNTKTNLSDHLIEGKCRAEVTYQIIIAITGNRNFKGIELEVIWEMTESCIVSIITYILEACNPQKQK